MDASLQATESGHRPLRVLFCGHDMHYGYLFTSEALEGEEGVEVLQCERSELPLLIRSADVAVPLMSRLDAQLLRSAERLKLIIQYGVGVEGIDMQAASELGIWVSNIPSAGTGNAVSCAEHAIYLMMAVLRSHNEMADSIRHRRLGVPLGQTLFGKTVLIVGFGNIAKELAVRLKPFGVRITALRRKPWSNSSAADCVEQQPASGQPQGQQLDEGMQVDAEQAEEQGMEEDGQQRTDQQAAQQAGQQEGQQAQPEGQRPGPQQPQQQVAQQAAAQDVQQPAVRLHQAHDPELDAAAEAALADKGCWPADCARLAGEADIIALTCHQDESNRSMVNAEFLAHCKQGVCIVNVARGGLMDYDALSEALFTGQVAGLGLDVHPQEPLEPDHWLVHHPCVYLTPHIAGVTEISYRNMARIVADAVLALKHGQPPARLLNAPERPRGAEAAAAGTDDIYIRPQDVRPFEPWLPINGGNRTVLLLGARGGGSGNARGDGGSGSGGDGSLGPPVTLDFGGAVNLMYHPVHHQFITYNLALQGMAPASSGYAAGLTSQMVGGAFWPSTTGEPHHLMAFFNSTIRLVSATCGRNSTAFSVAALHQVLGRNDTVTQLDDQTFFVGQRLNGSYTLRVLPTGDAAGNVRWSWDSTTVTCVRPQQPGGSVPSVHQQTVPTGIAANADELLHLLDSPAITTILLGGHISLQGANLSTFQLPIVLQGRQVDIQSNDELPKVLDLGGQPQLVYLSATSSLTFQRVHVQGAAPPSQVMTSPARTTLIVSPSLWPTIDGEAGHQLIFEDASLQTVATPCSRNNTQIQVDLLCKMLGDDAVQHTSDTSYAIAPRFQQPTPIRSILTREQLGSTPYTFERSEISCIEDAGVGLAAELQAQHALPPNSSSSGGLPGWVPAVIAVPVGLLLAAAAMAGVILQRRRRRRRAATRLVPAKATTVAAEEERAPLTPRTGKMDRMESGELKGKLPFDSVAGSDVVAASPAGTAGPASPMLSRTSSTNHGSGSRLNDGSLLPAAACPAPHQTTAVKLWRARFTGVIEGLEIGELLGRGAYGRVYKGRWNGAIVAAKVVEHSVAAGASEAGSMSREPLLCMSVSHPNCITTYKLSAIRLLRGEGLMEPEDSASSVPLPHLPPLLLSGTEGVEVADPYGPLEAGLYETWMVLEYCDRGSLADALAERRLVGKDGRTHMVAVLLCLLDVASGMSYLHSLGIVHGDLKPANVLLKGVRNSVRGFQCKLGDFGLSRMLDGRSTYIQTGSLGTPTHAAPELLREGRLAVPADVYAFGVLAWELVAGEEAWRGQHPMQIILAVTQQGARPPPLLDCPPPLAALMAACWQEDPQRRPTFADLLPQLQGMLQAARKAGPPQPLPSRVASARSSAEVPRPEGSPAPSPNVSASALPPAADAAAAVAPAQDGS
ncbi:kinase [Chlorella sorokiniana]|uniref:Kinase n=1 Tax=Chlorella sorokiniana TaxID=3076 RepID=A0A2P6TXL1_CHLSO|nr:kinase [Chlorella sorokiniana]|eukprot:PRW58809.1 kinase [Chlorella sorokiniana]